MNSHTDPPDNTLTLGKLEALRDLILARDVWEQFRRELVRKKGPFTDAYIGTGSWAKFRDATGAPDDPPPWLHVVSHIDDDTIYCLDIHHYDLPPSFKE